MICYYQYSYKYITTCIEVFLSRVRLKCLKLSTISTVSLLMRMGCRGEGVQKTITCGFISIKSMVVMMTPLGEVKYGGIVVQTFICQKGYVALNIKMAV